MIRIAKIGQDVKQVERTDSRAASKWVVKADDGIAGTKAAGGNPVVGAIRVYRQSLGWVGDRVELLAAAIRRHVSQNRERVQVLDVLEPPGAGANNPLVHWAPGKPYSGHEVEAALV